MALFPFARFDINSQQILCLLFENFFVYFNFKLIKEEERVWQERNP